MTAQPTGHQLGVARRSYEALHFEGKINPSNSGAMKAQRYGQVLRHTGDATEFANNVITNTEHRHARVILGSNLERYRNTTD